MQLVGPADNALHGNCAAKDCTIVRFVVPSVSKPEEPAACEGG